MTQEQDTRSVPVEMLLPFAKLLQKHNDCGPDARPVFAINEALITLGDLRKIRAIIDQPKEEVVAPAVQEAWQLVPKEPTEYQLYEGAAHTNCSGQDGLEVAKRVYEAMLAAAPQPKENES